MKTKAFAFFDVDGTLLHCKSMFSFHDYWYRQLPDDIQNACPHEGANIAAILNLLEKSGTARDVINRRYYEFFAGRSVARTRRLALAWFNEEHRKPQFFIKQTVAELRRLQTAGIEPVFVSGSFQELLAPLAAELNVKHVLASRLLTHGGCYTGKLEGPQTIGEGKATAIHNFLREQNMTGDACWAFGDDLSDLAMLNAVGNPVAVIGDKRLQAVAQDREWPCLLIAEPLPQALAV